MSILKILKISEKSNGGTIVKQLESLGSHLVKRNWPLKFKSIILKIWNLC